MDTNNFENLKSRISNIENEMFDLMENLFPICRSITGNGVRKTDEIIGKEIPLEIHEVPTGTKVFDWTVPKEWNIKDAYVINPKGEKIIDFKKSNIHILNYSIPIRKKLSLEELKSHLYTLPEQPDLIPYRTSYYKENWGFCLTHNQLLELEEGEYEVVIESTLKDGSLTYGEYYLKGESEDEFLISCYTCHPSMANDNLSGIALATFMAKYLSKIPLKKSYRFLFVPETIGSITWLCLNEKNVSKIKYGLVATCLAGPGKLTYRKSRQDTAEIDKVTQNILKNSGEDYRILDYFPPGSEERQYGSQAFQLPIGSLMHSAYDEFPEYHTASDDMDFVQKKQLGDSFLKYLSIIFEIENNVKYVNLKPKCEPQLGKIGLYQSIGAQKNGYEIQFAMISVLNLSDGNHSLLDISDRTKIDLKIIESATDALVSAGLLKEY